MTTKRISPKSKTVVTKSLQAQAQEQHEAALANYLDAHDSIGHTSLRLLGYAQEAQIAGAALYLQDRQNRGVE